MKKIAWKKRDRLYGPPALDGYVGRLKLFEIHYDGITSGVNKYSLVCFLSTLRNPDVNFEAEEEAQSFANTMIKVIYSELK